MKPAAVLFDLDGTLLDSLQDIAWAANVTLASLGLPGHPAEAYKRMVGEGARSLMVRAIPEAHQTPELVERALALYKKTYGERWQGETCPYPGIPELLSELVQRGIRLAILSNKPQETTERLAERWFAGIPFEAVCGAREGIPLKPDPRAALEIASRMGIESSRFVYLGDTSTDMHTARGAGMFAVGVLWGFRDEAELLEAGAQAIIAHPVELFKLLQP